MVAQMTPLPSAAPCQAEVGVEKSVTPNGFGRIQTEGEISTTIAVVVGADGKIEKAAVYKPSGVAAFDQASLQAARASTYRPKIVDCTPVESMYYFKTTFAPNP
jgi:TonB family protein